MQTQKVTPKDFFLHLGAAVGLYVSAVSLLSLLFQIINYAFPDQLTPYMDPYSSGVRWSIAMLLIFFPIYLLLLWIIERDVRRDPAKKQLWIRRWISYLTLFVASLTIAIDLVVLVNSFLGGDLPTRFVLKVISVLIVAGTVFGFYFFDLRRDAGAGARGMRGYAIAAVAIVVVSFVGGFLVMGSPSTAREIRFDDQRVNNLSTIQWQIVDYWQRTEKLPVTLDALKDPLTGFVVPTDPQTGVSYQYAATGALTFKLCATFARESNSQSSIATVPAYPSTDAADGNWKHGAGEVCFDRTIDPSRYPPRSKTAPTTVPAAPKTLN